MNYRQIINRLIAADDLHYDPQQRRYVSLSSQEMDEIIKKCQELGIDDDDEIAKVVAWFSSVRVAELLQRSFMAGRLKISGFSGNEPIFTPRGDAS